MSSYPTTTKGLIYCLFSLATVKYYGPRGQPIAKRLLGSAKRQREDQLKTNSLAVFSARTAAFPVPQALIHQNESSVPETITTAVISPWRLPKTAGKRIAPESHLPFTLSELIFGILPGAGSLQFLEKVL